jgi:hypothetical protein
LVVWASEPTRTTRLTPTARWTAVRRETPPQITRPGLRGEFIRLAKERNTRLPGVP